MMLSPAMQPEAMGMVYMSCHLAAFFSRIQTISAPTNMGKLVRGGDGQCDAQRGRRGRVGLGLGKDVIDDDDDHAQHEGHDHGQHGAGRQRARPLESTSATPFHINAEGAGNLSPPRALASGTRMK